MATRKSSLLLLVDAATVGGGAQCQYVPAQYTGTVQDTGNIDSRVAIGLPYFVTIKSSSRAKRFYRHYREQCHYAGGRESPVLSIW